MPSSAVFLIWHVHGTKELATAVVTTEDQAKIGKHSSRQHQLSSAASQNERMWKGDRAMLECVCGKVETGDRGIWSRCIVYMYDVVKG